MRAQRAEFEPSRAHTSWPRQGPRWYAGRITAASPAMTTSPKVRAEVTEAASRKRQNCRIQTRRGANAKTPFQSRHRGLRRGDAQGLRQPAEPIFQKDAAGGRFGLEALRSR